MLQTIAKVAVVIVCGINAVGAVVIVGCIVYDQIKYGKDPLND